MLVLATGSGSPASLLPSVFPRLPLVGVERAPSALLVPPGVGPAVGSFGSASGLGLP